MRNKKNALKKPYELGYKDGYDMGSAWYVENTYAMPLSKSTRTVDYIKEYDRGYWDGFWKGRADHPIPPEYNFRRDTDLSWESYLKKRSDSKEAEDAARDIIDIIGSSIKASFISALCKINPEMDYHTSSSILLPYFRYGGSFINVLYDEVFQFYLRTFLVEASVIYDFEIYSQFLKKPYSWKYVEKRFLQNFGIKYGARLRPFNSKWIDKHIERYFSYLKRGTPEDLWEDISRTTLWRRKKDLQNSIQSVKDSSIEDFTAKKHGPQEDSSSHQSILRDYYKKFKYEDFIANDFVFFPLRYENGKKAPTFLPLQFSAYAGFICTEFSGSQNVFQSCETLKANCGQDSTENYQRQYEAVIGKYTEYCRTVDFLLDGVAKDENLLGSQYICNDFLLRNRFLHYRFFASLDGLLFDYLSNRIDLNEVSGKSRQRPVRKEDRSALYYTLLKYLHYFDIDMHDLEFSCSDREKYFDDDKLLEAIEFDEIANRTKIPLAYICACLKEAYNERGSLMQDLMRRLSATEKIQKTFSSIIFEKPNVEFAEKLESLANEGKELDSMEASAIYQTILQEHYKKIASELKDFTNEYKEIDDVDISIIYQTVFKYVENSLDVRRNEDLSKNLESGFTNEQKLIINHFIHLSAFKETI